MSNAAITISVGPEVWHATDWQRLWRSISSTQRRWHSLALVPGGPGASPEVCLQVAVALAQTGMTHLRTAIHVADATRIAPAELAQFSTDLRQHVRQAEKMIVALSALSENSSSLGLAKAADSALLCVLLGAMSSPDARDTVSQIGAGHFIGSAVFHLPPKLAVLQTAGRLNEP
jgi:hypothetical protein